MVGQLGATLNSKIKEKPMIMLQQMRVCAIHTMYKIWIIACKMWEHTFIHEESF